MVVVETTFVGREEELAALAEYVREGRRLVAVVGPPGAGKTRTLREFGRRTDTEVVWCELAAARNAEELLTAVANAVGCKLRAGDSFDESVVHVAGAIDDRGEVLVLLDNFEQIVEAAPNTVGVWLERCPEATFIASSRHRLELRGEYVFDLEPLTPADAFELFVDRAQMVRRDFDGAAHGDDIAELVERLDRLPLAIELAAARVAALPPAELLARLDVRFKLLRTRKQGVDPRQATLEAAIDWSWELLDEAERSTLAQCSLFHGGFTLDAAEAVVDVDEFVFDLVESLQAKSLVASRDVDGSVRFVLYESIRDFAAGRLAEAADAAAARRRHAVHFAEFGRNHADRMHGAGGQSAMQALEGESANLFAAFERMRGDEPELALRLAASLDDLLKFVGPSEMHEDLLETAISTAREHGGAARFLRARADLNAVRGRLDAAIEDIEAALESANEGERGLLMLRFGETLRTKGNAAAGAEKLAATIEIGEQQGDIMLVRMALGHQASCYVDVGDFESARDCLDRLRRTRRTDDLRQECELLKRTAYVQYYLGNIAEQRRQNEEALELAREIGDRRLEGLCLQGVADSAFAAGDFDEAVQGYERALEIHRSLGNRHFEAMLLGNLGGAYHRGGNFARARKCYARGLDLHRETGARPYEGVVSFALGALEHESGNADDAHFHYDRALDVARDTDQPSDAGALLLCKTWLDLESASFSAETLRERATDAREALETESDSWGAVALATSATIDLLLGDRDVAEDRFAEAEVLLEDADGVERAILDALLLLRDVSSPGFEGPQGAIAGFGDDAIYRRSLHARLSARLVRTTWRRAIARTTGEELSEVSDRPTVTVASPDVKWFQFPGDEKVDLRRRKALRLVLTHLIERLEEEPGRGSDVHEVFEMGWPGENIHPDQAVERVYWAVRTLRKLGFEEILLTTDEGYHLREDLLVRREA